MIDAVKRRSFARVVSNLDYHAARHADELERESRDADCKTERAMHKADGVRQPITYRQWMIQTQRPAPSADEEWLVNARTLCDAQQAVDDAIKAMRAAEAYRDATFAALNDEGMSQRQIGAMLGISAAQVNVCIQRHRSQ